MNNTTDPMNPDTCNIRRVENGWVINVGGGFGCVGTEYVFTTPSALADFIRDNFKLPQNKAAQ